MIIISRNSCVWKKDHIFILIKDVCRKQTMLNLILDFEWNEECICFIMISVYFFAYTILTRRIIDYNTWFATWFIWRLWQNCFQGLNYFTCFSKPTVFKHFRYRLLKKDRFTTLYLILLYIFKYMRYIYYCWVSIRIINYNYKYTINKLYFKNYEN